MKITDISVQARNPDRVNISVDGKYRLSLDVYQVTELGIKNGVEVTSEELAKWEEESTFGKLYARALEYTMVRPHSAREIKDYLWRKTRATKYKTRKGEIKDRAGVSQVIADRVFARLQDRGYIDDEKFVHFWLENRNARKGTSTRKLVSELRGKGIGQGMIDSLLPSCERSDETEIDKIIAKKRARYDDQKLMQYLARHGFDFDLIKSKLNEFPDQVNETD